MGAITIFWNGGRPCGTCPAGQEAEWGRMDEGQSFSYDHTTSNTDDHGMLTHVRGATRITAELGCPNRKHRDTCKLEQILNPRPLVTPTVFFYGSKKN